MPTKNKKSAIDPSLRTFFHPQIHLSGSTEHAMRMFHLSFEVRGKDGNPAFDSISKNAPTAQKLEAIDRMNRDLDTVAQFNPETRSSILWEYFLATDIRFHHFAVEDNEEVATAMAALIERIAELSRGTEHEDLQRRRKNLVEAFQVKARHDYEQHHREANGIPNKRAQVMVEKLQALL